MESLLPIGIWKIAGLAHLDEIYHVERIDREVVTRGDM